MRDLLFGGDSSDRSSGGGRSDDGGSGRGDSDGSGRRSYQGSVIYRPRYFPLISSVKGSCFP